MTIILDRTAAHLVNAERKEFICDTESDVAALPADCAPGSDGQRRRKGRICPCAGRWKSDEVFAR